MNPFFFLAAAVITYAVHSQYGYKWSLGAFVALLFIFGFIEAL